MTKPALEIVDLGVDWCTITSTNKSSTLRLLDYGHSASLSELKQGNYKRDFTFKGYSGWTCGGISYGARPDGGIFIARGGLAREHYQGAFDAGTNCSRLDCQVTIRVPGRTERWLLNSYKQAAKYSRSLKRGPRVDIHRSTLGGSTVYLGSRASETFGRIYDKGSESLLDVMQGCVRYETEFKGDAAFAQIKRIVGARKPETAVVGEVSSFIRNRHCDPGFARTYHRTIVHPKRLTDYEKSLDWIRVSIRPTLERLLDSPRAYELLDCLPVEKILQRLAQRDNLSVPGTRLSEVA
jgi:hypothetical protein